MRFQIIFGESLKMKRNRIWILARISETTVAAVVTENSDLEITFLYHYQTESVSTRQAL